MKTAYMIANGDLRTFANGKCEQAQVGMEKQIIAALEREGWKVERAHAFDTEKGHGLIDSQKYGMKEIQKNSAPDQAAARFGLFAKACVMHELGMEVSICGNLE